MRAPLLVIAASLVFSIPALGGAGVVFVEQAVARIYPCLESVFFNLCLHLASSRGRRSRGAFHVTVSHRHFT